MHDPWRPLWRWLLGAVALTVLFTGCQVRDRAGGVTGDPSIELTMASASLAPGQVTAWTSDVERRSRGTLRITVETDNRPSDPQYETELVHQVREGTVDLAWVGARVFDRLGVPDFQPLVAPMLIDSLDLQQRVFEAGIPTEMLPAVDRLGVVGVGVLPGPMRKVLGVDRAFTGSEDFVGATVGTQDGAVAEASFAALGAVGRPVPAAAASLEGLDAYDQQLASIFGNHYADQAGYVTGNLNLWPRPLVIIANTDVFGKLSKAQRDLMIEVARSFGPATAIERDDAAKAATGLCRSGLAFAQSTPDELADLERSLEEVRNRIDQNPAGRDRLGRILELKASSGAGPDTSTCSDVGSTAAPPASTYDGNYRMFVDWSTVPRDGCPVALDWDEELGRRGFEILLRDGTVQVWEWPEGQEDQRELGFDGTFVIFRNRMQVIDPMGTMTLDVSLRGDQLTFTNLRNGKCDDVLVWTTKPWQRQ